MEYFKKLLCILTLSSLGMADNEFSVMSFNVQRFGLDKATNEKIMDNIVNIIKNFDISCIQEIVDVNEILTTFLLNKLNNQTDNSYEFIDTTRLGRSSYKEQYACYFKKDKIELMHAYQYHDPQDDFERDPLIIQFKAYDFNFNLIVVHIKPTDAANELRNLSKVIEQSMLVYDLDNVIILGDLNADCAYISKSKSQTIPLFYEAQYMWVINSTVDTTTGPTNCAYDRIILRGDEIIEYFSNGGVYRFDNVLNLTAEETGELSDHYPVYSAFTIPSNIKYYVYQVLNNDVTNKKLVGTFKQIK